MRSNTWQLNRASSCIFVQRGRWRSSCAVFGKVDVSLDKLILCGHIGAGTELRSACLMGTLIRNHSSFTKEFRKRFNP